jgi:hypothetical protein
MQDGKEDSENGPTRKKARTEQQRKNPLTRLALGKTKECKCGKKDHMRVSSLSFPWRGLSKVEVTQKYPKRIAKNDLSPHYENTLEPTAEPKLECNGNVERESGESEEHVQPPSKYFGALYESTK